MRRLTHFRSRLLAGLLGAAALGGAPAWADYVFLDYGTLDFAFTRNGNAAPIVGDVIGSLVIDQNGASRLTAQKYDFGLNDQLDGPGAGDDVLLNTANDDAGTFGVALDAVVRYLGPNAYSVESSALGFRGTDSSGATTGDSMAASFASTNVMIQGFAFVMTGDLGVLGANDAILLNNDTFGPEWNFIGSAGSLGLSGAPGAEDRRNYDSGSLVEIQFAFPGGMTLDQFFRLSDGAGATRTNAGADMKVTVVPEPATLGVMAIAGALLALRRRS